MALLVNANYSGKQKQIKDLCLDLKTENPIATSITNYPNDDLDFPKVTICPPKDSNAALYHDLVKAGNGTISDENRATLRRALYGIFTKQAHKNYAKKMRATMHMGNMDQVFHGIHSLPSPYNEENGLKIKMWNLNGTITTPWFQSGYVEDYYKEDREFLMVLELPEDIKDQVDNGSLIIELDVDTKEEQGRFEEVNLFFNFTLHTTEQNWTEAESICQTQGGHLASVLSEEVFMVINEMVGNQDVWLGGKKGRDKWIWSDNSTRGFTNWNRDPGNGDCVDSYEGKWYASSCSDTYEALTANLK